MLRGRFRDENDRKHRLFFVSFAGTDLPNDLSISCASLEKPSGPHPAELPPAQLSALRPFDHPLTRGQTIWAGSDLAGTADTASYKKRQLKAEQDLLIVTSTHGEGDPPQPAVAFLEFIEIDRAPRPADVRFAVFALGVSTRERRSCETGKRFGEPFGVFTIRADYVPEVTKGRTFNG